MKAILLAIAVMYGTCGMAQEQNVERLTVSGGEIEISLPDSHFSELSREDLIHWVRSAATAVSVYYGHFPVRHLGLRIRAREGSGIRHGVTFPTNGGTILITVGRDTTLDDLQQDWTMTHEMIHLAFPSMEERHHWIEEGLSTYVEPVARARVGQLSAAEVWKQFIENMPKGQPSPGDQGLDLTHTWGRTYWGGALFCLIADVKIREHTHNHKGLQDALRAILDQGGIIAEDWPIEKALATGDRATGTHVLQDLYHEMATHPVAPDLKQLWQKLGVATPAPGSGSKDDVVFDDHAPDARIRKSILSQQAP